MANGHEAVEAITRLAYDVVFMDCHMPDMDGYEAFADGGKDRAGTFALG